MEKRSLRDGTESFEVTAFDVERPTRTVLFAVGGGGNPERHGALLSALADHGCAVVAPHFDRLVSPVASEEHLILRARRLRLALDSVAYPHVPVVGVGHSIGAAMLLALAGGKLWVRSGAVLPIATDVRVERLALFAPATGFFQGPGALDAVCAPLLVWTGGKDTITPPGQGAYLRQALGQRIAVDLREVAEAGHFSFMDVLPPQVTDTLRNREAFLAELASEVCRFAVD